MRGVILTVSRQARPSAQYLANLRYSLLSSLNPLRTSSVRLITRYFRLKTFRARSFGFLEETEGAKALSSTNDSTDEKAQWGYKDSPIGLRETFSDETVKQQVQSATDNLRHP